MVVRNTSSLKKKLGDILVDVGIITREQLNQAVELQRERGGKLGDILKEMKFCSEDVLLAFLGRQCGVSYISLAEYGDIPMEIISLVPENVVRHQTLIPIAREGNVLTIAMSDPLNVFATDDLKLMTGCDVKVVIASEREIKQAIEKHYSPRAAAVPMPASEPLSSPDGAAPSFRGSEAPASMQDIVERLERSAPAPAAPALNEVFTVNTESDEAPVIKMVNVLLANAVKARASDIHIEPYETTLRVRYRLDGVMHNQPAPPKKYQNALASRVKVMAQMDVAERRLPQDGRIKIKVDGKEVDLRVSCVPTAHGEKIVLRVLDSEGLKADLSELGMDADALAAFKRMIGAPHGMVLVTGPTGSGKSTTLYSALSALNRTDVNVATIEDPVEYKLEGINQMQARPEIGLTFAAGLRALLRQDPDVILVGEIRDPETAEIAVNAALTGHLLLSTLHTNDAASAITRLNNIGVEPFLTASTLVGVLAQRLVRVLCDHCKEAYNVPADQLAALGLKGSARGKAVPLHRAKGCDHCAGTGYRGRMGVYELLVADEEVRALVLARAGSHEIKKAARKAGTVTLREAALAKMTAGITTLEEVLRVTQDDSDADLAKK